MTEERKRHVVIVLDRSGSMTPLVDDTEGGLKTFIEKQREAKGTTVVSLHQFNDRYDTVYEEKPLGNIPEIRLYPLGLTALLDAVGRSIEKTCYSAPVYDEIVFVILTDGHENASREFTRESVKNLVEERKRDGWQFFFLGADLESMMEAEAIGIDGNTRVVYDRNRVYETFSVVANSVTRGSNSGVYSFTKEERDQTRGV